MKRKLAHWESDFFFEPRDLWIGCYWDTAELEDNPQFDSVLYVYLILIPTLPLKLSFYFRWEQE